jgi:hypothetical protein
VLTSVNNCNIVRNVSCQLILDVLYKGIFSSSGAKMVTKKAATKVATKASVLKFNPEWFSDPPPPFFKNLDRIAQRELAQAKKEFQARVKEILAKGQR